MTSDTKTALLDVAEHAARARGFDGFSYADLAEAVGIRKASIHYHFPTKAALSAALMDRYSLTLEAECNRIRVEHKTGAEQLLALIDLYRDALNDGKTLCLCVSLISSRESLSDDVIQKIRKFRAMMVAQIEEILKLGQEDKSITGITDPISESRAILALLEGAHLTARAEENVNTFDEALGVLKSRC
ncbi:TetR/AcrR family transcriptional regulator [uncultured Ruegeria sp.]|uniref:TetR/AcrR family transcriptional regulator n=1 Tax=uncultured Ruegeria sp. TaxID=259304 RepID=UPI002631664C|nr:TetR/AcrR family transcriptional regulator [uncultured Ruegeria sp.]